MSLVCLLFGHRRSKSLGKYDYETGLIESVCRRCNVAMVRTRNGHWELGTAAEKEPVSFDHVL
jgi:hypothetical protein